MESNLYQGQLVRTLQEKNPGVAREILQAFQVIPRSAFVDHYYVHESGARVWCRYEREESVEWDEQVYRDEALVTRVDQYGRTLSSSSQPSVMALMLEALEVQPGMRVLEIGTGTGYNAALLAHLVGDPALVTTVDIDEEAIARAKQVLPQVVGAGMTMMQADGISGYDTNAPYDRIVITAGAPRLPRAWWEQLAPGGVLVGVLQPPFTLQGGLLQARKCGESLQGRILRPVSFMELRPVTYRKRAIQVDFRAPICASFACDARLFQPRAMRENADFSFFLAYDLPGLYMFQKNEALYVYQEEWPQGYVVFRQQEPELLVDLCGEASIACGLWNRLIRAYGFWDRIGQPVIAQYAFAMDGKGQALSLSTALGMVWPFGVW